MAVLTIKFGRVVQKLLDNWDRKGIKHYFEVGGHGSGMMNRD